MGCGDLCLERASLGDVIRICSVSTFSTWMTSRKSFGLDKCGWMLSKRGKMSQTEGVELPEVNEADVDNYKDLWVLQENWNHGPAARVKYLRQVRQVL